MNLSKMYVDEFRMNIARPLQEEVGDLKNEIAKLKNAIQRINDCDYRSSETEVGCFLGETLGAFGFQGLFLFVMFFGIVDKLVGWKFG